MLVPSAAALAVEQRAVAPCEAVVAQTGPVDALAVARAIIRARADRAIEAGVAQHTEARRVVAHALSAAVGGANAQAAIVARPAGVALAHEVHTITGARALIGGCLLVVQYVWTLPQH